MQTKHKKIIFACSRRHGFGMIEMIVGAAILAVTLLGISSFFQSALTTSDVTQLSIRGDYLLEEGVESVKLLRDAGYTNNIASLSVATPYYTVWNGTAWATTTTDTFVDGLFERSFTITNVARDINDDIAGTGTNDPNTKLVTVSVAWSMQGATTTHTLATYVTNLFNN